MLYYIIILKKNIVNKLVGGRKDPLNVDPKLSLKDIDIEKKL